MPSRFWRIPANRVKKCSEKRLDPCDVESTDLCCEVVPCRLCLTFAGVEDTVYGEAEFSTDGWFGAVGSFLFFAYWERDQYTGECEFVVTINNEEVYRKSCYEGASCRDPGDTVEFYEGALTWEVKTDFPLPHVTDPDTGCKVHFCGACNCTCECLCVTLVEPGGASYTARLCASSAEGCGGPVWAGNVGFRNLSFTLESDENGECIICLDDGYDVSCVSVTECLNINATWNLSDGATVTAVCGGCGCVEAGVPCSCDGRCNPLMVDTLLGTEVPTTACENPMPVVLGFDISSVQSSGGACFNGSGEITFKTAVTGGLSCWEGDITGNCTDCNGNSRTWSIRAVMCCVNELGNLYTVTLTPAVPAVIAVGQQSVTVAATSCDPFLLEGCIPGDIVGFVVGCISGMLSTPTVFTDVCFQVYETP